MNPAKKIGYIDVTILDKKLKITSIRNEHGIYKDNKFYGIRYYNLDEGDSNYVLENLLPKDLHDKFDVFLMIINHENIIPHTDSDYKTVINYYIKSSEGVTSFWKLKNEDQTHNVGIKLDSQTDGRIYKFNDLNCVYNFKAKDNELWILNVKEIHSVFGAKDERIAFSFASKLDYIDVLKYFDNLKTNSLEGI